MPSISKKASESRCIYPSPTCVPTIQSSPVSPRSATRSFARITKALPANAVPMSDASESTYTGVQEMPMVASVGPYAFKTRTREALPWPLELPQCSTMSSAIFSPPTMSARSEGRSDGTIRRPWVKKSDGTTHACVTLALAIATPRSASSKLLLIATTVAPICHARRHSKRCTSKASADRARKRALCQETEPKAWRKLSMA